MPKPSAILSTQNGQLGVLPSTAGRPLVVVGAADKGSADVPTPLTSAKDVEALFGAGPGPEALASFLSLTGLPGIFVRTGDSVLGAFLAIDNTGVAGTSVPSPDNATEPNDAYHLRVKVIAGGTVGTAGITYQTSVDGGTNYGPIFALGTATTITIPRTGGAAIDFAAGTLLAGDVVALETSAPAWNDGELTSALAAVGLSSLDFEIVLVVGDMSPSAFNVFHSALEGMAAVGKRVSGFAHVRNPAEGETEAAYLSSLGGTWASAASDFIELGAGACDMSSALTGARLVRPGILPICTATMKVPEHKNVAAPRLGGVPVGLKDALGNPRHHDEQTHPGLSDLRFSVLRTIPKKGIHPNRPQLFSAAGSDFALHPHRRVFNLGLLALDAYLGGLTSEDFQVDLKTGFIREEDALSIENGARAAMNGVLSTGPKASGIEFVLSRVDNLLSTATLSGEAKIVPLGYAEYISVSVGFKNPALNAAA